MIEGRRNAKREAIEARWGCDLWALVRAFAEQGLSRAQTAKALGYSVPHFCAILRDRSDVDPFEEYGVVANYVRQTGEAFSTALRRMAAAGYTFTQAQREIGYCNNGDPLKYAMRVRGIEVEFAKVTARPKPPKVRATRPTKSRSPSAPATHPWRLQAQTEVANRSIAP